MPASNRKAWAQTWEAIPHASSVACAQDVKLCLVLSAVRVQDFAAGDVSARLQIVGCTDISIPSAIRCTSTPTMTSRAMAQDLSNGSSCNRIETAQPMVARRVHRKI